jgi:hypothetical protein
LAPFAWHRGCPIDPIIATIAKHIVDIQVPRWLLIEPACRRGTPAPYARLWTTLRWIAVRFGSPASRSGREMVLDEIGDSRNMGLGKIVISAANDMKAGIRKKGQ